MLGFILYPLSIIKRSVIPTFLSVTIFTLLSFGPPKAYAAAPQGSLDRTDLNLIAGWARDPDYTGSIQVHIYVDGVFVRSLTANQSRPDVGGNYGFRWTPHAFGSGEHSVRAYAIGVDANGNPNDQNLELSNSPKNLTQPRQFTLINPNGTREVKIDSLYGGIIGSIVDNANHPGINQVVSHGGAGQQFAFWLLPRHNQLPPNCPDRDDMWYDNPTQGGYYANLAQGNPIGLQGTQEGAFNPNEFIRYQNNGQEIHFKSKFIRHDYCLQSEADLEHQELWDTNFFLEQVVRFDPNYQNALKVTSTISHVGTSNTTMDTRGFISFTNALSNLAYQESGELIITDNITSDFFPENAWAAAIDPVTQAGHGFVFKPTLDVYRFSNLINGLFGYNNMVSNGNSVPRLTLGKNGHAKLHTFGTLQNVQSQDNGLTWVFQPQGEFTWTHHIPIGHISQIRNMANQINTQPAPLPGDINQDGQVNLEDYRLLITDFNTPHTILDFNLTVANFDN